MWSKHLNWWVSSRQDIMRVGPVLNGLLSLEVATISPCITLRHLTLRSWFLTWMSARLSTFSLAPVPSCYTYQHRNVRAISHNQKLQTYQHFRVGQSYPWEIAWTSPPFQQESNFQSNGMKDIYAQMFTKTDLFCISKHYHTSWTRHRRFCLNFFTCLFTSSQYFLLLQ